MAIKMRDKFNLALVMLTLALASHYCRAADVTVDIHKDDCVLGSLLSKSDLIIVGTVLKNRRAAGNQPFVLPDGDRVNNVGDIRIDRVLASGWNPREVGSHIEKQADSEWHLIVCQLPPVDAYGGAVLNDPSLLEGGRYLLWLKQYPLREQDAAIMDVPEGTAYRVTNGHLGAILLSDPKTLPGHAIRQKLGYDPLKRQNETLEKHFCNADAQTILKATEEFVTVLAETKATADAKLKQLSSRSEKLYAVTADSLAKAHARKPLYRVELASIPPE